MIEIKIAEPKDTEVLALLGRVTYVESHFQFVKNKKDMKIYSDEAFSIKKLKSEISNPNIIFFLALVDNLPVGFAKLILNNSFDKSDSSTRCKIDKIYVLEDFIGMKLGWMLLDSMVKKAKSLNYKDIWLATYIKNHRAINFYKKCSFKITGKIDFVVNGKPYENHIFLKNI